MMPWINIICNKNMQIAILSGNKKQPGGHNISELIATLITFSLWAIEPMQMYFI